MKNEKEINKKRNDGNKLESTNSIKVEIEMLANEPDVLTVGDMERLSRIFCSRYIFYFRYTPIKNTRTVNAFTTVRSTLFRKTQKKLSTLNFQLSIKKTPHASRKTFNFQFSTFN